jgi:IS5 family transposase
MTLKIDELLSQNDKNQAFYADSAYVGQEDILKKYEVIDKVYEKEDKNKPLTVAQKLRVRVRVEHVFGFMENSMGSMYYRKIGIKRAEMVIGLMNLTYNMFRKIQLTAL